jgi:hypothetical protein
MDSNWQNHKKTGRGANTDLRTEEYPNNLANVKRQNQTIFCNTKENKST